MATRPVEDRVDRIVRLCYAGLDADTLLREALARLRRVMTVDAAFLATVDPGTILFTSALAEEPLHVAAEMFLQNEFGRSDVNKFADLAAAPGHVSSLDLATKGEWASSARYRDVMAPLRLGDELRAALVVNDHCWGVLCLHREQSAFGFDDNEIRLVRRVAPHLAEGLRRAVVAEHGDARPGDGPGAGVLILDRHGALTAVSPEAEHWLAQIGDAEAGRPPGLPRAVSSVAARLAHADSATAVGPSVHLRTRQGRWLTVQASLLTGPPEPQIAVVLAPATPNELHSLLLAAYGLTPAQQRVAELVLRGRSTHQIVRELRISAYTVQEHLRRVFDKLDVGSRQELIAALMAPG